MYSLKETMDELGLTTVVIKKSTLAKLRVISESGESIDDVLDGIFRGDVEVIA